MGIVSTAISKREQQLNALLFADKQGDEGEAIISSCVCAQYSKLLSKLLI